MNTHRLAFLSLILSLALAACSPAAISAPHSVLGLPSAGDGSGTTTSVQNYANTTGGQSAPAVQDAAGKGAAPGAPAALDRIVIKTATLSMVVARHGVDPNSRHGRRG